LLIYDILIEFEQKSSELEYALD